MVNRSKTKGTSVFDRLWERVAVGNPSDCWEWGGYCRPGGHGQIGRDGKLDGTHRVAWESENYKNNTAQLAEEFGVTPQYVNALISGKWRKTA